VGCKTEDARRDGKKVLMNTRPLRGQVPRVPAMALDEIGDN